MIQHSPHLTFVRHALAALAGSLLLTVVACGGGSSPTEPGNAASSLSVEAGSYILVNEARRGESLPELMLDPALSDVARHYSERMRDEHFFGHTDPMGGTISTRLGAVGVRFRAVGENLASVSRASDPARAAHNLLMASPLHRANILNRRFEEIGVGAASDGETVWITQVFIER